MLNLMAAALFHLLEQQLAAIGQDSSFSQSGMPCVKLLDLANWYAVHVGVDLRALNSWNSINELRLLANVVKHAEGNSSEELRELRPDLFAHPDLMLSEYQFARNT